MRYLEFSIVETGLVLYEAFTKQFDIQDDFTPSTISFSMPRDSALTEGLTAGTAIKVTIDGATLDTYFLLGGNSIDYVTESGVRATAFNGLSIHTEFEDASVLPSAWPNPVPSGHDFQNATPGTIVKTLILRSQEQGFLTDITTDTFTGTHDSGGNTWPAMVDRSYSTGDTDLSVLQGLIEQGLISAKMVGYDLQIFAINESNDPADPLDVTLSPDEVAFRVGQNCTQAGVQEDSSEFYTDIFAIGDGDAAVMKTRPASYNILGRRRMRFAQYGGITDTNLVGVLADLELDQYNHIKKEHSVEIPASIYTPFIDYSVHNLVPFDSGNGALENIRIKQISVTQSDDDGDFSVGVTLGDILEDADEKLKRRLDAITGANAGGGAVPSDKTDDKNPPDHPASVTISSLSYIDSLNEPKVAALVDWPDVVTNADGTPTSDVDHYEVQRRSTTTSPSGDPQTLTPGRPNDTYNTLFDRRSKEEAGWIGGDGADATRNPVTGKDYWVFGDSAIGFLNGDYKPDTTNGKPYSVVNNSMVVTDPADPSSFKTVYGMSNLLDSGIAMSKSRGVYQETNSTATLTNEWAGYTGQSHKIVATSTADAKVSFGKDFFGNRGATSVVYGEDYIVTVLLKQNATPRTVELALDLYDNSGNLVGTVSDSVVESSSEDVFTWVKLNVNVVNSVTANVTVTVKSPASGEAHFVAKLGLFQGSTWSQTWNAGGGAFDALIKPQDILSNGLNTNSAFIASNLMNTVKAGGEVRIGWLGDSVSEGAQVTGDFTNRTQTLVQKKFRALRGNNQKAVGYVPAQWGQGSSSWVPAATTLSATNAVYTDLSYGLGGRSVKIQDGGYIQWNPQYCSEFDIYYLNNDFFAGTFQVYVDGDLVKTINSYNPDASGTVPVHTRIKTTPGVHTIKLVGLPGLTQDSIIQGIEFRDGNNGLYVVDNSHTGFKVTDYSPGAVGASPMMNALKDSGVTHLVCMFGANDMASFTPEEWATNLENFVSYLQSSMLIGGWPIPVTFIHWGELPTQPATGGANPVALSEYEAAAANSLGKYNFGVEWFFLSDFFPSGKTGNQNNYWSADGVHPNNFGCDMLSDAIISRLYDYYNQDRVWLGSTWSNNGDVYSAGMQLGFAQIQRSNLARNPSMKGTVGTVYTGSNATVSFVSQSGTARGSALKVTANAASANSCASVDGDTGGMRSGLVAGKTYTISAIIKSSGDSNASNSDGVHCITVFYGTSGSYTTAKSPSVNGTDTARVSVTVTIPTTATEAFIRLYNGGSNGTPDVTFADLLIEETDTAKPFFDGTYHGDTSDSVTTMWNSADDLSVSKILGTAADAAKGTIISKWDADTLELEKADQYGAPGDGHTYQWSTAARVEDSYAYLIGKNSSNQPVLSRCPVGDPYTAANVKVWTGSSWTGNANIGTLHTDPYTFDSIRKWGSSYSAYYMKGFDGHIYRKTASSITGPWTTEASPVYLTPEYGGNEYTYIPRMYPQFDSGSGAVYGYSTNYWTSNGVLNRPRFASGPVVTLVADDIEDVAYSPIEKVTESKAYYTGYENNTALQVRVRTVDTSGLVSPSWTESTPTVLTRDASTLTAPSKPAVTPLFQGLRVSWDGLDANGIKPTADWLGVEVHVSAAGAEFGPTSETRMDFFAIVNGTVTATTTSIPGLDPGKAYWVKLRAVATDGLVSAPSAVSTATTEQLVSADLTPKLIDAAKYVQDGSVNTAQLNVAAFSEQIVANADFEGGYTFNIPNTWTSLNVYKGSGNTNPLIVTGDSAISGNVSWQHTVAPNDGRLWVSQVVALVPGDIYYFAGTIKTSRTLATENSISIGLAYAVDSDLSTFALIADRSNQAGIEYPLVPFTGSTDGVKVEGQLHVPEGMYFGCLVIQVNADDGAADSVTAVFDDLQLRRIVGTANIANAAINNAQIADLAVDDAKIANASITKLTAGVLSADMTISSRIKTANSGQRVELNSAGLQGYNSSGTLVTQVTTEGGLISEYFRTNTSGSRIEMGTYSNGANSANIAFFSATGSWQFPPIVGYGGGGAVNYPGVALHGGSRSVSDYNKYGLSMIGLDQQGGVNLITGNLLDGTESTTGANINIDAGGSNAKIYLRGGGANRASLTLSPTYGDSYLHIPGGAIDFNNNDDHTNSNALWRSSAAWAGFQADHMVIGAGGGVRFTSYDDTDFMFGVKRGGHVVGNGDWGVARIQTRADTNWVSWDAAGNIYKNGSVIGGKTFVIDHPVKPDNYLVHVSSEMPEARVEYTGNGKLTPAPRVVGPSAPNLKDNFIGANDCEIVLPDYFTALVDESTAVVTVSPYYHDCDDCGFHGTPSIAATKVKDGKFRVKATGGYYHPCISFAWRVSAVRKDIPQTVVEPSKSEYDLHGDGPYTYLTKKNK